VVGVLVLLGTVALLSSGARVWTLPDDALGAYGMRLSGSPLRHAQPGAFGGGKIR
jgi:hypothetical protein